MGIKHTQGFKQPLAIGLAWLSSGKTSALAWQSCGFESHPSDMPVNFFSQDSRKYWVYSALRTSVLGQKTNNILYNSIYVMNIHFITVMFNSTCYSQTAFKGMVYGRNRGTCIIWIIFLLQKLEAVNSAWDVIVFFRFST